MMKTETALLALGESALGRILEIRGHGQFVVTLESVTNAVMRCGQLRTSEAPVRLAVGDRVLVWFPEGRGEEGVVLGRIGPSVDTAASKEVPDELVIEAKKGLVLRVGEGSITIRADGKILIKGKDLVSHAKRMNRIRGGSVTLN